MSTFTKKYGIGITNDNPDGSSAQENQAIRSLKGDSRAPDVVDVGASFAISGTTEGLYAKYFNSNFTTIPRAMKDTRGYWIGDYWGAVSIGYNASLDLATRRRRGKDLLKPEYKGKVALNGSPLTSNSAVSVVFAAALANGGSLSDVTAGHRLLVAKLKKVGQLHPRRRRRRRRSPPARRRSRSTGTTTTSRYIKEFPAANWKVTRSRPTACTAAYYAQAINATAPHPNAARLWEEFIYSDQGQIIWLKGVRAPGTVRRHGRAEGDPEGRCSRHCRRRAIYNKVKFASLGQQTKAKALIASQWPSKVGS